ncbi:hypothetical protein [Kribbella speibonae]|uniref:Secreted protein n=1 Tax=Kribbella speibonae TaxID=1572660 RepID=A0ABY2A2N7_9ACTN|nr:hypothetical protein [Kribbella speibonae]TCC21173.1 hypothetical protein E0H58_28040 [Kribbella speibonae]
MRLLRALAVPAAVVLLLTSGPNQATAATSQATGAIAVVQAADADTDTDDGDTGTLTNPTTATAVAPAAMSPAYSYTAPVDHCILFAAEIGATCYQWVGDDQWVIDGIANGWTAVVHVQTNYGKDRYCKALPAAEGWGKCNYDHIEGKCARWQMYELKDGDTRNFTPWSAWYGTQYGYPC